MEDKDSNTAELNRRAVLRNVAAGASVAFVGTATAESSTATEFGESTDALESEHTELVQKYDPSVVTTDVNEAVHVQLVAEYTDPATIEANLRGSVEPILAELTERGYLAKASLELFDLDTVYEDEVLTPEDDRTGVAATTIDYDGVTTPHIMATTESNGYNIGLYHQSETENTYALVEKEGKRKVVHDFDGDVGVEKDCSNDYYCSDEICCTCQLPEGTATYYWEKKERCCLLADGSYSCETSNYDCLCDTDYDPACCS